MRWVRPLGALFPDSFSVAAFHLHHIPGLALASLLCSRWNGTGCPEPATSLLYLLGATQLANCMCWQPFLGLCSLLGGRGPTPLRGGCGDPAHVCLVGQVCLILGSIPGMSTSHRCTPALTSSVKKGLLSFLLNWFRTQTGKSCYLPLKSQQLKETRLIYKNFYFLPNSGLSSKSHPPFPYVFGDPASLF